MEDVCIRNCVFAFKCDKKWEELNATDTSFIKFCDTCQKEVWYCDTDDMLRTALTENLCVAIDRHGDRTLGTPCVMPAVDFREADAVVLGLPISDLELTFRVSCLLESAGFQRIGDLIRFSEAPLLALSKLDQAAINEIKEVLAARGLTLGTKLEQQPDKTN